MKLKDIDGIYCLMLDSHKYTIPYFNKVSTHYGINIQFYGCGSGKDPDFKYDRIDTGSGKTGGNSDAKECHRNMIRKAKVDGYKTILMLEDDSTFTNDADEILSKIKLPDRWHSIQLGGYTDRIWLEDGSICREDTYEWFYDKDYDQPQWTKCYKPWGFMGRLINGECFDYFINDTSGNNMDHGMWNALGDMNPNRLEYILSPNIIFERQLPDCTTGRRLFERMYIKGRILHCNEF